MSSTSKSGIQVSSDGSSRIPASTRADGSTRKEIRVRPGYRPPEDVETYKNRSAEAWKHRGSGGVPGTENLEQTKDIEETKGKNAKRREAAKRKKDTESIAATVENGAPSTAGDHVDNSNQPGINEKSRAPEQLAGNPDPNAEPEAERQKKIRNQLKKLRAVRDLKEKRVNGDKLTHDQLLKIGKEDELLRDLKKLSYDGPEMSHTADTSNSDKVNTG